VEKTSMLLSPLLRRHPKRAPIKVLQLHLAQEKGANPECCHIDI
jgi:hypothetical protein